MFTSRTSESLSQRESIRSFTLVELLIVIAILAILAAAVVVVINPMEMLRQGRDSVRMREIGVMNRALNMFQVERSGVSLGLANRVYISIPSENSGCTGLGLPILPFPWEYVCSSTANHRNIDGTGWIPVDFATLSGGVPLTSLPVDPVNASASSNFYAFVTDGRTWALTSLMESERHAPSAGRDGGNDFARFEAGNNLALWTTASGLVGYWSFDGTGNIVHGQTVGLRDTSGRDNHGTAGNANATGMAFVPGRVGNAVTFDGVDDFVNISLYAPGSSNISFSFWIKRGALTGTWQVPIAWGSETVGGVINFAINNIGQATVDRWTANSSPYNFNMNENEWYHIVGVWDGGLKQYVNGVYSGNWVTSLNITIPNSRFGMGTGGSFRFRGQLDEVFIYNRALSAAEVRTIFNATRQ